MTPCRMPGSAENSVSNFNPGLYYNSQQPKWNADGSMDPNGPGFQTVNGIPYYLNGIDLAGVERDSAGPGQQRLQHSAAAHRASLKISSGNGKTVLRGGFGTFFERMQGNDIYNAATTPPYAYNPSAGSVYFSTPNKSWVSGNAAPLCRASRRASPTSRQTYKAPAVAQFSLGVQREVMPSMIWVVQYVGNLAWHQNIERHFNNYPARHQS